MRRLFRFGTFRNLGPDRPRAVAPVSAAGANPVERGRLMVGDLCGVPRMAQPCSRSGPRGRHIGLARR